jgi:hypothetical protein
MRGPGYWVGDAEGHALAPYPGETAPGLLRHFAVGHHPQQADLFITPPFAVVARDTVPAVVLLDCRLLAALDLLFSQGKAPDGCRAFFCGRARSNSSWVRCWPATSLTAA